LSGAADDDVHLEEGIENIDIGGAEVGLVEGADSEQNSLPQYMS
jgi:hypothetical protein